MTPCRLVNTSSCRRLEELPACILGVQEILSAEGWRKAGKNYRGPAVYKGARGPTMLHIV
jgi:hypothetical protein